MYVCMYKCACVYNVNILYIYKVNTHIYRKRGKKRRSTTTILLSNQEALSLARKALSYFLEDTQINFRGKIPISMRCEPYSPQ